MIQLETEKKKRIEYIDAIRGFAIILVVYWHLAFSMGIQWKTSIDKLWPFMMPLFFFISGYFAYSHFTSPSTFLNKIKPKIQGLLIPTFIVGTLYYIANHIPILAVLMDINKRGYWFTLVLFEIFILYAILNLIIEKTPPNYKRYIYWGIFITVSIFSMFTHVFDGIFCWQLFSMFHVVKYFPFFILGILARIDSEKFNKILENGWILTICIILYITFSIYICKIGTAFNGYAGIVITYAFFHHHQAFFSSKNVLSSSLSYIGQKTLPIYLSHYFFIPSIIVFKELCVQSADSNSWLTSILLLLALSFLVIGVCLFIEFFLRMTPPLYILLFGPKKK